MPELYSWDVSTVLAEVEAYPSFVEEARTNMSIMECGFPTQLSFSAREVADGTFYKAIEEYDPDIKKVLYHLDK